MPAPWSNLGIFAVICALIALTGWLSPPGTPLWLVIGLAILATVLIVYGPDALARVLLAAAEAIGRWRGH